MTSLVVTLNFENLCHSSLLWSVNCFTPFYKKTGLQLWTLNYIYITPIQKALSINDMVLIFKQRILNLRPGRRI